MAERCRTCKQPIRWAITDTGRLMPLDFDPVDDGNIRLGAALDYGERKDRELARKIAAVPEPIFDARRARRWRGCDIDPAFASTELEAA